MYRTGSRTGQIPNGSDYPYPLGMGTGVSRARACQWVHSTLSGAAQNGHNFCSGAISAAELYPTVKAALRHEIADSEEDREGLVCHVGQGLNLATFQTTLATFSSKST